mmetsp:Transcript_10727/g.28130  ORF Transcript_10727/g.28130 Transcript_10727/m.28130 type:complete len:245 (-) Transcript_10727:1239-1973(-)
MAGAEPAITPRPSLYTRCLAESNRAARSLPFFAWLAAGEVRGRPYLCCNRFCICLPFSFALSSSFSFLLSHTDVCFEMRCEKNERRHTRHSTSSTSSTYSSSCIPPPLPRCFAPLPFSPAFLSFLALWLPSSLHSSILSILPSSYPPSYSSSLPSPPPLWCTPSAISTASDHSLSECAWCCPAYLCTSSSLPLPSCKDLVAAPPCRSLALFSFFFPLSPPRSRSRPLPSPPLSPLLLQWGEEVR